MSRAHGTAHEARVVRRLEARGDAGLGEALMRLDGCVTADGTHRIESLYAVGSEGAVYVARNLDDPAAPPRAAKVALLPLHRPFDLTEDEIRVRRARLREEAGFLDRAASPFLPRCLGFAELENPALERDWGGAFEEPEPCLLMEWVPGFDLDAWLARMHAGISSKTLLRRQLDHVAVVVLRALLDLHDRGFAYADLRPGNIRIRGRGRERTRLLDAGSLVAVDDRSGRFPHVPAYLPPELFAASRNGEAIFPSPRVQAGMAGRTLYEVATGRVPTPGEPLEMTPLHGGGVSSAVAETIARLCEGEFTDPMQALAFLSAHHRPEPEDERPKSGLLSARPRARAIVEAARAASPRPAGAPVGRVSGTAGRTGGGKAGASSRPGAPTRSAAGGVPSPVSRRARPAPDLHSVLQSQRAPRTPSRTGSRAGSRSPSVTGSRTGARRPARTSRTGSATGVPPSRRAGRASTLRRAPENDAILPPRPSKGFFRRVLDRLFGR